MEGVEEGGVPVALPLPCSGDASSSLPHPATCVRKGLPQRPRHLEEGEAAILGLFRQQGAVLHPSQEKRNPVTAGGEGGSCQAPAQPPLGTKFSVGFLGVTRVPQKVAGLRDTEGHIMRGSIYVKYLEQANSLKAD